MSKQKIILLGCIALVVVVGIWLVRRDASVSAPLPTGVLDVPTMEQEIADGRVVLLDVRTSEERLLDGYIEHSVHFDIERLRNGELPILSKGQPIYVYCRSGGRAGEATAILKQAGFVQVINIGGLSDWVEAGGSVIKES